MFADNQVGLMKWGVLMLLVPLMLLSVGCKARKQEPAPTEVSSTGKSEHHLKVGGKQRRYVLYVPRSLDSSKPAPLIIAIHGGGSKPESFGKITGLDRRAGEERGYVIAYPAGYKKFWHSGDDCCGPPYEENVDDVAFIRAVLKDVKQRVNIDDSRVYAAGFSNGGKMTYRLACKMTAELAAVAINGSSLGIKDCHPNRPLSVLHFHGTADTFHPYAGGRGTATRFQMPQDGAPATTRRWRDWNGCVGEGSSSYKRGAASCVTYNQCQSGAEVVLCTVEGMGHQWPGFEIKYPRKLAKKLGPSTKDLDATKMLLDFFSKFRRDTSR